MLFLKLLIYLQQFYSFAQSISLMPGTRSLKFDRFDGMCRSKNVPMRIRYEIAKTEATAIYMNSTVYVSEDIPGHPAVYITVRRCQSKENLDTCEDFLKPKPNNYCTMLDTRIPTPGRVNYSPKFECPITKGTYYAYNYKMDLSAVLVFPLGNSYWRMSLKIKDDTTHRLLHCLECEGYLLKGH